MKQEFIPWEQAFELKQLGFKEECLGEWQNLKSGKNLVVYEEHDRIFDVPVLGAAIGAPLYQQAFRFFRDKFKLFSYVELHLNFPIRYYFIIYEIGNDDFVCHTEDETIFYDKYEEAELACLKKLIEIKS